MKPRLLSASSLSSDDVCNPEGQDLGSVKDLMINLDAGRVEYAVVQFGGFLGMGSKYFAIPFDCFSLDTGKKCLVLNTPKDTLKQAKGFDPENWPDFADPTWRERTRTIFHGAVAS
jgi:sporulation protein YlmC with PRC-barrel domain